MTEKKLFEPASLDLKQSKMEHGGALNQAVAKYGGSLPDWIDLSTGINPNPYPVPPLRAETWARLPEREAEKQLEDAARIAYQVPDDACLTAAPGTQSIIQQLPGLFQKSRVGILQPTYNEHAACWRSSGHDCFDALTLGKLAKAEIAIVVNPNNPTASVISPQDLVELAASVKTLIVDEAFCDALPDTSLISRLPENALVMRSFGKFFGLAGLRLGFLIGRSLLVRELQKSLGPWAISGPALEIGREALSDLNMQAGMRGLLERQSGEQVDLFREIGLAVTGVNPLFIAIEHEEATALADHLARNHILVRQFSERPTSLRFGIVKDARQLGRLKSALEKFLEADR